MGVSLAFVAAVRASGSDLRRPSRTKINTTAQARAIRRACSMSFRTGQKLIRSERMSGGSRPTHARGSTTPYPLLRKAGVHGCPTLRPLLNLLAYVIGHLDAVETMEGFEGVAEGAVIPDVTFDHDGAWSAVSLDGHIGHVPLKAMLV